ncbi:MAG: peptidoglycan DD-metalloendopeptidase family protein [Bacteroidales bacterium]|nr:peptidoglycan DD-metalloendopeptidase family protein [Bacteroidales bacterium]MCF8344544.1 peptidoglycan DD-metalloendopeptidase family protein [Bacteroidales bacterium]MCF8350736.1 peptidoglycan DD-metalloendopeptidase family protein [Bacteroidales bacterium]MCF8376323.1 peptidoglycan DD-metalloendopeptidase family protein [Bacteroidales bacterium]MCF8401016.1 peptidoglycan DD-metalloendopeptidase family protein [Bacteroidales bacterium]
MRSRNLFALYKYLSLVFILFICLEGLSQDKKSSLEKSKKKIEQEIAYTNRLLSETKQSKKTSLNQLVILNNKIKKRDELIENINAEIKTLEVKIISNNKKNNDLKKELDKLKDEYARMIYYAYKNKNLYDRWMFIFSSKDFNQAYQRLKYFQQYSDYRKTQAELIVKTQKELNTNVAKLENQKEEKVSLLKDKEKERNLLEQEKQQQNEAYSELSKREKNLLADLRAKEKEATRLQNAIEEIIEAEMRAAAERAKAESSTSGATLTAAELNLSKDFVSNKGELPWPSDKGLVSSTFGEHQHPVLRKVKIKNNGINILTEKGQHARAIFGGTVVSVKTISSTNKAIIIKHGEYFSVYSNLAEAYVKRGELIATLQNLGLIYTNPDDGKTELHFEIWKGRTLLNPASWLSKSN